jgi:hypothetical protein
MKVTIFSILFISLIQSSFGLDQVKCPEFYNVETPEIRQIDEMNITSHNIYAFLEKKGYWGKYYVKQICGSKAKSKYHELEIEPINLEYEAPKHPVELRINKNSEGLITAKRSCHDVNKNNYSQLANRTPLLRTRIVSTIPSIFMHWAKQINLVRESSSCRIGDTRTDSVSVIPVYKWTNRKVKFPANKGFYGSNSENKHKEANEACAFLYHPSIIKVGKIYGCIGYTSTSLNEIQLITVDESLYITRTILRQKNNFHNGQNLKCNVKNHAGS